MKKFTIIFTLILTTFAADSNAQYTGGMGSTWNNPVSAMLSQKMWGDINGKMLLLPALRKLGCTQAQINKMNLSQAQNALAKKTCAPGSGTPQNTQTSGRTTSTTKSTTPPAAVYSTTFKPTGTRIAMPQIVAEITPNDKALQQRQIDFLEAEISKYERNQRARGYGDDAAAAMAFFASVAIHLQDTSKPVNQKGVDSLTDALRGAFADKLAGISDRDKQELYENLLTLGMFIAARAENADAKTRADLKELSASLCDRYMKLDVTKYRFDDNGLVEIRSAKNVPAPGGKATTPPSGGKIDSKLIGANRLKLIGQWEYKLSNIDTRTYIFRSDATFYFSVIEGTTIYTWTGNYTVSDKTITFKNIVSSTSIGGKRNWADTVAAEYKFEKRDDGKGEWLLIAPLSIPDRTYLSLSLTSAKWSKTAKTTANLEKATPKVEPKPETASQGNGTFTKGKIDPKLIGSWQASTAEIYVFHADGRFNHFSTQSQVEGRFTVSGGKIHFSNIVYEKGKTWEKRYPDAVYEYELGKDGQGDYLNIPNFLYGVTYVDIKTAYRFRK